MFEKFEEFQATLDLIEPNVINKSKTNITGYKTFYTKADENLVNNPELFNEFYKGFRFKYYLFPSFIHSQANYLPDAGTFLFMSIVTNFSLN